MIEFDCNKVYSGWPDVGTPDDIDVTLRFNQTTHEFYPALRELVLLYDAIVRERDAQFSIGLGNSVTVSTENVAQDMVEIKLPPLRMVIERAVITDRLESLLVDVFKRKNGMSNPKEREEGLEAIQYRIDQRDGQTDVPALYTKLVHNSGR